MARVAGTVKWFSQEKGYGFIRPDEGPEVFVHHTAIQTEGFRILVEGERVEFEVVEEARGPKAQNVVRLDPQPGPRHSGPGSRGAERSGPE
jgi:CspA family cold shock protein